MNELWKQVTPKKQENRTLFEFIKDFKEFLIARRLVRYVLLDVDPAFWDLDHPLPWPIMNWHLLDETDATGDGLVRHLLLDNVDRDVRLTVEHLEHASEIWRALLEVTCCYLCVLCMERVCAFKYWSCGG